jgi:tryptophanyl-tRNA synthetase
MYTMNEKPVVLTGLRVNNALHIGNYLGALLPMIDFAKARSDDHRVHLFIPDLHSITTPVNYDTLQDEITRSIKTYLALGLPATHENVLLYRQSMVPAHSELTWLLSCFTGFGEMSRMTQFKDRSAGLGSERTSVSVFSYPILMAADILLYDASYVPVGDDQSQHLEFARDIAERMNGKFGNLFTVPHPVKQQHEFFGKDQGLRIRDLQHPEKKMSKSNESEKGVIFLHDTPETARKKIMSAATDSLEKVAYDYEAQPGISNLLDLLALFGGDKQEFIGQKQYGPLKNAVADSVSAFLAEFHSKYETVDANQIEALLEQGEQAATGVATTTLERVQRAVGLRR